MKSLMRDYGKLAAQPAEQAGTVESPYLLTKKKPPAQKEPPRSSLFYPRGKQPEQKDETKYTVVYLDESGDLKTKKVIGKPALTDILNDELLKTKALVFKGDVNPWSWDAGKITSVVAKLILKEVD